MKHNFHSSAFTFAEPVKPTVIYSSTTGMTVMVNGSNGATRIQKRQGEHMLFDLHRNTIIWFGDKGVTAYDWMGGNFYHLERRTGFRICSEKNDVCATILHSEVASMHLWIQSFALDSSQR